MVHAQVSTVVNLLTRKYTQSMHRNGTRDLTGAFTANLAVVTTVRKALTRQPDMCVRMCVDGWLLIFLQCA